MNRMKKIKILFLLPVALFMASCSEDTGMNTYPARGDEAFFDDTEYSYVVSAKMEDAYSVEVLRANKSGDASVGVTIKVANSAVKEAFTAPASVEFKDGEIASSVKISFDRSKLTIGDENEITVNLQSETDLPYATECKLVVVRDYTWSIRKERMFPVCLPQFSAKSFLGRSRWRWQKKSLTSTGSRIGITMPALNTQIVGMISLSFGMARLKFHLLYLPIKIEACLSLPVGIIRRMDWFLCT